MLCALFNSQVLFASIEPSCKRFIIQAIVRLDSVRLDTVKNGKGEGRRCLIEHG